MPNVCREASDSPQTMGLDGNLSSDQLQLFNSQGKLIHSRISPVLAPKRTGETADAECFPRCAIFLIELRSHRLRLSQVTS